MHACLDAKVCGQPLGSYRHISSTFCPYSFWFYLSYVSRFELNWKKSQISPSPFRPVTSSAKRWLHKCRPRCREQRNLQAAASTAKQAAVRNHLGLRLPQTNHTLDTPPVSPENYSRQKCAYVICTNHTSTHPIRNHQPDK